MASRDLDYAVIYNQLRPWINRTKCSPVMAIHRMYFKLDDLHVDALKNPEVVKDLYVFADVVEMEGERVELPGSSQITMHIVPCSEDTANCRDPIIILEPGGLLCETQIPSFTHAAKSALGNIIAAGTRLGVVQVPVKVTSLFSPLIYPPGFSSIAGTVKWRIPPYSALVAAGSAPATASSSAGTVGFISPVFDVDDVKKWHPSFKIVLSEVMPLEMLANSNIVLGVEATTLMSEVIIRYQWQATETVATTLQHESGLTPTFSRPNFKPPLSRPVIAQTTRGR
ncbi:hypothetical protein GOP47_0014569 [Adiantum capillus-veneris]|uniref:Uncharacterized protein n=1 Tax=Adiantum capillus-veneris TaxID=13818 RepID=A0A9D4ZEY7_ADICA|nr:hypothetical protein GOP47_0014569 [Adiantum capillus-veneris]